MGRRIDLLMVFIFTVGTLASGTVAPEDAWEQYTDKTYQVTLRYPRGWKENPHYGSTRFEGQSGFFMLLASEGDSPEQVCRGAAEHKLQPYGSRPEVRPMKVQGQRACMVWPSNDQGAPWDAQIVVEYPKPMKIDGDSYGFLVLDADKDHILQIVRTLKFISFSDKKQ